MGYLYGFGTTNAHVENGPRKLFSI